MSRFAAFVLLAALAAHAAETPELDVIPAPKKVTVVRAGQFEVDEYTCVLVSGVSTWGTRVAAREVQLGLRERFSIDVPILRIAESRKGGPHKAIWVVEPRIVVGPKTTIDAKGLTSVDQAERGGLLMPEMTIGVKGLTFSPEMVHEGYFIRVDAAETVIHGASDAGSFYAAQTLVKLFRPPQPKTLFRRACGPTIPSLWIADWPSKDIRTVPVTFPAPSQPETAEEFLVTAARYGYNGITRSWLPPDEAVRRRLDSAVQYYPIRLVEAPRRLGTSPLERLAAAAAEQGRLPYALAAAGEVAWGPPDPDPEAFRLRFAQGTGLPLEDK